jgi:hypothetical protein
VDKEPTRKHHVEGHDEPTRGRFDRPLVGPPRHVLSRGGCPMGPKVGPQCSLGFQVVFLPMGPSILGMSMCHPLIRWGCLAWISDWLACMGS